MTNTEIARIESMIQSAEAYGEELLKADECGEGITGIREERIDAAGSLAEALYRLEAETTPRVLEMARRVFSGYGDDEFRLDISRYDNTKEEILKGDTYTSVEVTGKKGIIKITTFVSYNDPRMEAIINTKTTSERRKFMKLIRLKDRLIEPNVKMGYGYLSESRLPAREIFKLIADRYASRGADGRLNKCVEMYARLPQLIGIIGERMIKEEAGRKAGLEESMQEIEKFGEGTK